MEDIIHRYLFGKAKGDPFKEEYHDIRKVLPSENKSQKSLHIALMCFLEEVESPNKSYPEESMFIRHNLREYKNIIDKVIPKKLESLRSRIESDTSPFNFQGTGEQKQFLFQKLKKILVDGKVYNFISPDTDWTDFNQIFSTQLITSSNIRPIKWIIKSHRNKEYNARSIHDLLYALELSKLLLKSELKTSNGYIDKVHKWFVRGDGHTFDKQTIRRNHPKENWNSLKSEFINAILKLVNDIE